MTSQATSLQNGYGFIKSALYRHISREFTKDQEVLELLWESDNKETEAQVTSLKEILDHLADTDPGLFAACPISWMTTRFSWW